MTELESKETIELRPDHSVGLFIQAKERLNQARANKTRLMDEIRVANRNGGAPRDLLAAHNQEIENCLCLAEEISGARENLKFLGWIFDSNNNPNCQIILRDAPTETEPERKLFEVADAYDGSPMKKGDTIPAKLSQAHMIPSVIREQVISSFTWRGDNADQLYAGMLEDSNNQNN